MRQVQVYLLVVYFASVLFAQAQTTTNNWSHRITSKTRRPLMSFISPHVSPINVLTIDGKRYENVRGLKKFYLQVPNTNLIVFVTKPNDGTYDSITYHIFNMDTDEDIAIHALDSVFGSTIGADDCQDSVNMGTNGIIVLCSSQPNAKSEIPSTLDSIKSYIYLDVNRKAIIAKKDLFYDKDGKLIDEHDSTPPF